MSQTTSSATSDLHKKISIEPNTAEGSDPSLTFTGKDNNPIGARVLQDGTLSFETASGQLFTVSHGTEGSIFAVNDISGMPSIEVDSQGQIKLAPYSGSVAVGKINATARLDVLGNIVSQYAFNTQSGTTYTLVAEDANKLIQMTSGSANTITIPLDADVQFPDGTQIHILQVGNGATTISMASGGVLNCTPQVSANNARLRTAWSCATLIKRSSDTWVAIGDLSA